MNYRRLYIPGGTYFFTVVTAAREPIFANPDAISLFTGCMQVVRQKHPFTPVAFVILPDHLHMIWNLPPGDDDFSTRWRLIKSRFTHQYEGESDVWQDRFWEHSIRDERDFEKHFDYIHFNPVKHGLVNCAVDWPHSSFQHFVWRGVYEADWYTVEDLDGLIADE